MPTEEPGIENTLAQMQDYPVIDLLWIILEATTLLKKRGMKIQATPNGSELIMYRRPSDIIGRMSYNGASRPLWTPTAIDTHTPRLPLTTRVGKA